MKTFRNRDPLLSRLRFHHLQLLELLAEAGSLRIAAKAMNQTQPALSKALREIEDMLGFTLFDRTPRGLRVSARGELVVRGASLLIAELRHIRDEAKQERGQAMLRLGAPPFLAVTLVPRVLQALLPCDPPVSVLLTEQRVPQLFQSLLAGKLDALLTNYSSDTASISGGERLCYEKLFDAEIVVIAPSGWQPPRPVTWERLAVERWILPERASYIRRLADDMFLRDGVAAPEPVIESTNPLTNVHLVGVGVGLAVVPALATESVDGVKKHKTVNITPAIPTAPVAIVYRPETLSHPRMSFLRTALGLR